MLVKILFNKNSFYYKNESNCIYLSKSLLIRNTFTLDRINLNSRPTEFRLAMRTGADTMFYSDNDTLSIAMMVNETGS